MAGLTSVPQAWLLSAALSMGIAAPAAARPVQANANSTVTDAQVQDAVTAISLAKGYNELIAALGRNRAVLASKQAHAVVAQRLREAPPNDDHGRRLLQILDQLFIDTEKETPETAASRYLVRLIAIGATVTGDSDQLYQLLMRDYEFSPKLTEDLIKPSLATPPIDWPPAMARLMTQFIEDWHGMGANEAARGFADALHASIDDPTGELAKMRDVELIGQWYSTQQGMSAEPEDTNLILTKTGVARMYVSTGGPEDFEGIAAGRWTSVNGVLTIKWDDGQQTTAKYQLSNGQLQWTALGRKYLGAALAPAALADLRAS